MITDAGTAAATRAMRIEDLYQFKRVADPQISPDGKWVVYQVGTVNLGENKSGTNLWLASTDGKSPPRRLTTSAKSDRHPRWSPDGKQIVFESNRGGESQLWVIDMAGGEARQLTSISTGASNAMWSPDGAHIAFVSAVYAENSEKPFKESDELNKKKAEEISKSPVKAKVFTRLFYRHWDSYVEDKRQHLFVIPAQGGEPKDVTPGDRDAYPTSTTFSVGDDFVFSPDSKYLVYTAVPDRDEAWSTNYEICRVPIAGGTVDTLTIANKAADGCPRFSPDGKKFAYRAQHKPGYEADCWELMIVDCNEDGTWKGKPKSITPEFDRGVDDLVWASNTQIFFTAEDHAATGIYITTITDDKPKLLHPKHHNTSLSWSQTARILAFTQSAMDRPNEVYMVREDEAVLTNLSQANTKLLSELDRPRPESVEIPVEGGVKMQMWILKPPGFDEKLKWPVVYLVHGGPQGVWEDGWSYRWNPEAWAAQGYVIALPNPRGSTGFGQKFVDEISGDWGGKCYRDLMAGADYVEKLPYVDRDRIASAGASFGGYMMNWFAVNTGRFKTLITHCSVWNFESMWGTTDELWFDEYEHGGLPWEKPGAYAEFSPHKKAANLGKFKTPMLIIHNDYDYRCPIGQGQELFTALQRQGVPSRFVNFPDEGHWVQKPKNGEFWHQEVFKWLKKYNPPGGK
jgi:dipeptidyl aminopeptidase/acylaminoacyl peptidase